MSSSGTQLNSDERSQLKRFVRLVHEMSQSRFIQRVKSQDHTVKMDRLGDDDYRITAPDYDWEDFRSFLTAFRQVSMSENESVYLPKVRNIVARYASPELRIQLGKLKNHIVPRIEGKFAGVRFGRESPDGDISFTSHELLNALVNGRIFHVDLGHEAAVDLMNSSEPWQYIWVILSEIIVPVLKACSWLAKVIRSEGHLDEADFPSTKA